MLYSELSGSRRNIMNFVFFRCLSTDLPKPVPSAAPSMRPGRSQIVTISLLFSYTPRLGLTVVNG